MADETLRVKLSAEGVAELVAALRTVGNESVKQGQRAKQSFAGITAAAEGLKKVLAPLAAAFTIGAITEFIRHSVELADALEKTNERLGGTIEQVTGLALAFRLAEVDITSSAQLLGVLSRNLRDFEQGGGKAAKALKQLGFAVGQFKGKSISDAVLEIARALAKLPNGFEKNALAADIFGRRAIALIPALNKLGREGIEKFVERMNRMFSPEAIQAGADFADRMKRLGFELQGLGIQFVSGFAEGITASTDATTVSMEQLSDAVHDVGKAFGDITRLFVPVVNLIDGIGTAAFKLGLALHGLVEGISLLAKGDFAGFKRVYDAVTEENTIQQARLQFRQDERRRLAETKPAGRELEPGAGGERRPYTPPAAPDLATVRAQADAELSITKEKLKAEEQANKASYDAGLLSLQEYYRARLDIAARENRAEVDALRSRLATVQDTDETKAATERAKIEGDIRTKTEEGIKIQKGLQSDLFEEYVKLHEEIARIELSEDRSRHGEHLRRMAEIDDQLTNYSVMLAQVGVVGEENARKVAELRKTLLGTEDVTTKLTEAEDAMKSLDIEREEIQNRITSGLISQRDGEVALIELEKSRQVALLKVAEAAHAAAVESGDEDLITKTEQLVLKVQALGTGLTETQQAFAGFKDAAVTAGINDVAESLDFLNESTMKTAGFFRAMVESIMKDLSRLTARLLALQLAQMIGFTPGAPTATIPPRKREGGLVMAEGGVVRLEAGGWVGGGAGAGSALVALEERRPRVVRLEAGGLSRADRVALEERRRRQLVVARFNSGGWVSRVALAAGRPVEFEAGTWVVPGGRPIRLQAGGWVAPASLAVTIPGPALGLEAVPVPAGWHRRLRLATGGSVPPSTPRGLQASAQGLTRALPARLVAAARVMRLAHGGWGRVTGPGGSRDDRIPALLSHGEFVVRAAIVRQPGVLKHLVRLNAGVARAVAVAAARPELPAVSIGTPALWAGAAPRRMAEGGLVSAGPAAGETPRVDGTIQVGLEDGLVVRALQSPAAQRVLIQVVNSNKQAIRQAIS